MIISSTIAMTKVNMLNIASSLHWNASPATIKPTDIWVNHKSANGVLKAFKEVEALSSSKCQHPSEKFTMVNFLEVELGSWGFPKNRI